MPRGVQRTACLCAFLFLGAMTVTPADAYTPKSPEVRAMVEKGVRFLGDQTDHHSGGKCLLALVRLKADKKYGTSFKSHGVIQEAIKDANTLANQSEADQKHVYNVALAIIFLCELDPEAHKANIKKLLQQMLRYQRPDGSWSYPTRKIGDTSVTQYGVLALWTAYHIGKQDGLFQVPRSSLEKSCNWLLRTQDLSGAWSYLGKDPGHYNRIAQTENIPVNAGRITPSMVVGGLGSLYMCAQVLGIEDHVEKKKKEEDKKKGPLKKVEKKKEKKAVTTAVSTAVLKKALRDGEGYYRQRCGTRTTHWQYYYLYGMERFHALQEMATEDFEAEPGWYNQGVDYLKGDQKEDGSWHNDGKGTPPLNTAFAIMFLLRPTQELAAMIHAGGLRGGRGLPKDLSNLSLDEDGRVVKPDEVANLENVLARIKETAALDNLPKNIKFKPVESERKKQVDQLESLFSAKEYKARIFAVKQVARTGDIQRVPALIYALGDPDWRVVVAARDGLRLTSRKFAGFGVPDIAPEPREAGKPEPAANVAAKKKAQAAWKAWYKSIRPDAKLDFLELQKKKVAGSSASKAAAGG